MWRSLLNRLKAGDGSRSGEESQEGVRAKVVIVALITGGQDQQTLILIAEDHGWQVHFAQTGEEAVALLNRYEAPIVLCDRDAAGTDWHHAIRMMSTSKHLVFPILVSGVADDYLWNEVMRNGGFDLLAKPLRNDEVLRTIGMAWSYWNWSSSMGTRYVPVKRCR